jgi:hypothetical protein
LCEGAADLVAGVLNAGCDHGAEELEDVLLVDRLVLCPALALDHLDRLAVAREYVAAEVVEPLEDAW